MPDLLPGRQPIVSRRDSNLLPLARAANLRALAVTSVKRWPATPELPTMDEQGFRGFDATAWFGLMAPAGTPAPVIARLHAETVRILGLPDVRQKLDELGMAPIGSTPEE